MAAAAPSRGRAFVVALGSPRLALWLIVALAVAVVILDRAGLPADPCLAPVLALLCVNLLAAVATHRTFRAQAALLSFHLALAAVALLAAAGRLTYLHALVEVTTGSVFQGKAVRLERGWLHPRRLEDAVFINRGFDIEYQPGLRRGRTTNRVEWLGEGGVPAAAVIGDQDPLVLGGYRFYTTPNKGFAPRLAWVPEAGAPLTEDLHLPSFPVFQFGQELEWNLPRSDRKVNVALLIDEEVIDIEKPSRFRVPARHRLRVESGAIAAELRPGESVALAGGRLVYVSLGTWMGYKVFYDPTLPWIFAAAVIAVLSLAAHFVQRWRARPWDLEPA